LHNPFIKMHKGRLTTYNASTANKINVVSMESCMVLLVHEPSFSRLSSRAQPPGITAFLPAAAAVTAEPRPWSNSSLG